MHYGEQEERDDRDFLEEEHFSQWIEEINRKKSIQFVIEKPETIFESSLETQQISIITTCQNLINQTIDERIKLMKSLLVPITKDFYKDMNEFMKECFENALMEYFGGQHGN